MPRPVVLLGCGGENALVPGGQHKGVVDDTALNHIAVHAPLLSENAVGFQLNRVDGAALVLDDEVGVLREVAVRHRES